MIALIAVAGLLRALFEWELFVDPPIPKNYPVSAFFSYHPLVLTSWFVLWRLLNRKSLAEPPSKLELAYALLSTIPPIWMKPIVSFMEAKYIYLPLVFMHWPSFILLCLNLKRRLAIFVISIILGISPIDGFSSATVRWLSTFSLVPFILIHELKAETLLLFVPFMVLGFSMEKHIFPTKIICATIGMLIALSASMRAKDREFKEFLEEISHIAILPICALQCSLNSFFPTLIMSLIFFVFGATGLSIKLFIPALAFLSFWLGYFMSETFYISSYAFNVSAFSAVASAIAVLKPAVLSIFAGALVLRSHYDLSVFGALFIISLFLGYPRVFLALEVAYISFRFLMM